MFTNLRTLLFALKTRLVKGMQVGCDNEEEEEERERKILLAKRINMKKMNKCETIIR